ncbi:MAG TPA: lipid-A-disaccharide synthase [Syntrophorhabdaceae bacterium]|nr:lipid-A-disaccharide synthase [Syntrophorhabdaceae bacterium]
MSRSFDNEIVLITGELSGELHAANLVGRFKGHPEFTFSAVGGKRLAQAGARLICDYRDISLTGVSEIFSRLPHILRAFSVVKKYIRQNKPALVVLVDFPGFNLRIARFAKRSGIPVVYFIPPQIWAWRKNRIRVIKKYVDRVICILPFEKRLYDSYGIDALYVGHPFIDTVRPSLSRDEFLKVIGKNEGNPVITIMPGSRENEIKKHLPVLIDTVNIMKKNLPEMITVLPLAENIQEEMLAPFKEGLNKIVLVKNHAYDALAHCDAAIVASGSVTLEAAILKAPTIVIYRISPLSYFIAKMLVKTDFISLPNIIAEREVFPEFIQDLDPEKIAERALYMVHNGKQEIRKGIEGITGELNKHNAYENARDGIVEFLEERYGALSQTP